MKLFKKIAVVSIGAMMAICAAVGLSNVSLQSASAASPSTLNLAAAGQFTINTEDQLVCTNGEVTLTINKSTSSTFANNYSPVSSTVRTSTRVYNGMEVIITASSNAISAISFVCSTTSYAAALGGSTVTGGTLGVSGTNVTLTGSGATTVTLMPKATAGMTSLTVTYGEATEPDFTIDDLPVGNVDVGATGTLSYTALRATSPSVVWSSSASSIVSIVGSTGAYEAVSYGQATITAVMTCTEGEVTKTANITVNAGLITIAEANTIASGLASGATTAYYVTIEGYLTNLNTANRTAGSERDMTLSSVKLGSTGDNILIYGVYSDNHLRDYAIINGTVRFKGTLQNYSGTYELTSPSVISYIDDAISFATASNVSLDTECAAASVSSATWGTLAANYAALDTYAKARLTAATASDSNSSEIADFIARYILIVNKYGYSNFMGHALSAQPNQIQPASNNVYLVVVIAMSSLAVLGLALYLKKRKAIN